MTNWKSGAATHLTSEQLTEKIRDLHKRFSRLAACYLIYRNGSRKELSAEARTFGLDVGAQRPQYSIGNWIVYMIVLIGAVYIGVYASAIAYDWIAGAGFNPTQDVNRTLAWIAYSLSNYGSAILVVLLLRSIAQYTGTASTQSHLITYCWTFVVAFLVGPLGLTLAAHFFGEGNIPKVPIFDLYCSLLRWGLGSGLVAVYISYYLDRQVCPDLPNIDHSVSTIGLRIGNCLGFATLTLVLLLPMLLALAAQPGGTWDSAKLRFIAAGTTFCLTFALAMAAQFVIRPATPAAEAALTPQTSG
jgi:hypothetical protein